MAVGSENAKSADPIAVKRASTQGVPRFLRSPVVIDLEQALTSALLGFLDC